MATNYGTKISITAWLCVSGLVCQQNADADTLQLRDVAMANIFWLSIGLYAVHIAPPGEYD